MEDVNTLMESWITNKREVEGKEHAEPTDEEWYASSSGDCPRKLYFQKRHPKEHSMDLLKTFQVGNIWHDFIQENLFKDAENETPSNITDEATGITIRGRLDILKDGVIYELKSIKNLKYGTKVNGKWRGVEEGAKIEHIFQLMIYLKARGLQKGKVVYIEKHSLKIVEHEVEFNEEVYQEAIKNFVIATKGLKENKLPDECDTDKCGICDYQEECQNGSM